MPFRGNYNILDINKEINLYGIIKTIPTFIINNTTEEVKSNIIVVTNNSNITEHVKIILPKILQPGVELKFVNLNKNFNLNIEVDDSNQTKINSLQVQITLKPLSNITLVSVSYTDWYIF